MAQEFVIVHLEVSYETLPGPCEMLWRLSTESCVRRQTGMILSMQKAVEIPHVRFQDKIVVMRNLGSSGESALLPVLLRHHGR